MGILDKVMFWKKKDDFSDLGLGVDDFGKDMGMGSGSDKDLTGLGGIGTGKGAGAVPPADLPGFGDKEGVFGGETPLTASPQAPFTPEVPQQQGYRPSAPAMMAPPQYAPPAPGSVESSYIISKELEIISTKLDALRAGIDSVSHRLAALERIARGENERNW